MKTFLKRLFCKCEYKLIHSFTYKAERMGIRFQYRKYICDKCGSVQDGDYIK